MQARPQSWPPTVCHNVQSSGIYRSRKNDSCFSLGLHVSLYFVYFEETADFESYLLIMMFLLQYWLCGHYAGNAILFNNNYFGDADNTDSQIFRLLNRKYSQLPTVAISKSFDHNDGNVRADSLGNYPGRQPEPNGASAIPRIRRVEGLHQGVALPRVHHQTLHSRRLSRKAVAAWLTIRPASGPAAATN